MDMDMGTRYGPVSRGCWTLAMRWYVDMVIGWIDPLSQGLDETIWVSSGVIIGYNSQVIRGNFRKMTWHMIWKLLHGSCILKALYFKYPNVHLVFKWLSIRWILSHCAFLFLLNADIMKQFIDSYWLHSHWKGFIDALRVHYKWSLLR